MTALAALSSTRVDEPKIVYRQISDGTVRRYRRPIQLQRISNATVQSIRPSVDASEAVDEPDVYPAIAKLFQVPEDVYFENGFESDFSGALTRAIVTMGDSAIEAIAHLVTTNRVRPYIAEESLRVLGRVEHEPTKPYRRWLLEQSLLTSDASIRDAASLGIADMDDPASIPALQKAIEVESCDVLRQDLLMVLRQLQSHGVSTSTA